jgi:tetratricopeptide (TPR) repeat protein
MASSPVAAQRDVPSGRRLDSWKEIAAFLGRGERTVRRWETERGLPVHRIPGGGRSAVFAYSDELAEWLKGSNEDLPDEPVSVSGKTDEIKDDGPRDKGPTLASGPVAVSSDAPGMEAKSSSRPSSSRGSIVWLAVLVLAAMFVGFSLFGHRNFHFPAMAGRHTPNTEAQDLYLKGRYFWDRRTPYDLTKAIDYFTQAIVKDPGDAEAYVGLADCYNLLREFGSMAPSEAYPRAISAAQRAMELDDASAEAHLSLAFGTYWWLWHGATAEREFKRALELDPKLVRAHHWYATFLLSQNRLPEALDQMEQAQRLEPSSNAILADKGFLLWQSGRHDEAVALLKQLETTDASFSSTHDYLGRIYWQQKDYPKWLAEDRRMAELRHDEKGEELAQARAEGFAADGLKGIYESELPVQKRLVDEGLENAYQLATVYAALGKKQEALAYLQTSFDRHESSMLLGERIPELQDDPQYKRFRAQVNQLLAQ